MKKSITAMLLCLAMLFGLAEIPALAEAPMNIKVSQTDVKSIKITGTAPAECENVTLVITDETNPQRTDFIYLRQVKTDANGSFAFRVKLRESDPEMIRIFLSGDHAQINDETTFLFEENFEPLPEEPENETTDREGMIEADVTRILNVLYIKGAIVQGTKKNQISFTVTGEFGELYTVGQEVTEKDGIFEKSLALNPQIYGGAQSGYLRIAGSGINIMRFPLVLYSQDRLQTVKTALESVGSVSDMKSVLKEYGEIIGIESSYIDQADSFYKLFNEYRTDFASVTELANCIRKVSFSMENLGELMTQINEASQNHKWSVICDLITNTYKDTIGADISKEKNIKNKKELYMRMCGSTYHSIEDILNAYEEAVKAQEWEESRNTGSPSSDNKSQSIGVISTPSTSKPAVTPSATVQPFEEYESFMDMDAVPWAQQAVNTLQAAGILKGDGTGFYRPLDTITREEFLCILLRSLGTKKDAVSIDGIEQFSDVSEKDWYAQDLVKARAMGVTVGKEDGSFGIGEPVTRADMCVMAYRAYRLCGTEFTPVYPAQIFNDYGEIPAYALDMVTDLQQAGVINGVGDGNFNPQGRSNRAQAAVLIWNLRELEQSVQGDFSYLKDTETELLSMLGILDEEKSLLKACTRGQFAQLLCKMQNAVLPQSIAQAPYADVAVSHPYAAAIQYVTDAGQMGGEAGVFRAEDTVTLEEACYALCTAAGYQLYVQNTDPVVAANQAEILKDVSPMNRMTVGQVMKLIYNTLHIEMGKVSYAANEYQGYEITEGYYVMEEFFDISYGESVIEGAGYTTLTHMDESLDNKAVIIDGVRYPAKDCSALLGNAVRYYYAIDQDDARELLFAQPDEKKNRVLKIDDVQLDRIENGYLTYYPKEKESSARVKLGTDIDVIYNGVAYPEFTQEDFMIPFGNISLIDNNRDGTYEVAVIKSYKFMVVGQISLENEKIFDAENGSVIELENNYCTAENGGEAIDPKNLRNNQFLAYTESRNQTRGKVIHIEVCPIIVSGGVTGISRDSVTVDGVAVALHDNLKLDQSIAGGDQVTLYIWNNFCVRVGASEQAAGNVTYLVNAFVNEEQTQITLKLLNAKASFKDFRCADKVRIDGVVYDDYEEILGALAESAKQSSRYSAEFPYAQPIRYRADSSGIISEIDTAAYHPQTEREDSLRSTYGSTVSAIYNLPNKSFYSDDQLIATLPGSATVYWIPNTLRYDPQFFGVANSGYVDEVAYEFEVFNSDEYHMPQTAFFYYNIIATVPAKGRKYIVTGVEDVASDGEMVTEISYLNGRNPAKIKLTSAANAPQLKIGDVIKFRTNYGGEVTVVEKCFDPDLLPGEESRLSVQEGSGTGKQDGYKNVYGTVLRNENGFISVTTSCVKDDAGIDPGKNLGNYMVGANTVFYKRVETREGDQIQLSSVSDLIPYELDQSQPSEVYVEIMDGEIQFIYQIN